MSGACEGVSDDNILPDGFDDEVLLIHYTRRFSHAPELKHEELE